MLQGGFAGVLIATKPYVTSRLLTTSLAACLRVACLPYIALQEH
jgi:hypothetical protein